MTSKIPSSHSFRALALPGTLLMVMALFSGSALAEHQGPGSQDSASEEPTPQRTWHAELGQAAPEFELTDLDGRPWKLSDHRGKTVVLEWFNPECPVVKRAHSEGSSLAKLGDEAVAKGVVWVAINSGAPGNQGTGVELNRAGKERMGFHYPVLLDASGWVGRMYGATNTPHMFVINKEGVLAYRGGHEDKQGRFLVEQALLDLGSANQVSTPRTKAFGCTIKYARKAAVGLVAPNFKLADYEGHEHELADLRGNYVVLEWFNPGCPVVKKAHSEGASLETAARRHMADGVKWLAINSGAPGKQGASVTANLDAKKRWGLQHPILADSDGKVGRLYDAKTTPQMVLIDPRGVIVYAGAHQDKSGETFYIDQALAELRAGRAVSVPQTRSFGCSVKYGD